jgi:L,D-transpeptidase catalytic domain
MSRAIFTLFVSALCAFHAAAVELDPDGQIRPAILAQAETALETHADQVGENSHLIVVDYSLHSREKRLFVVDLVSGAVSAFRAAHGRGSDKDHDGYLDAFSDRPGSSASPEGAYLVAEEYSGKHGRSLRLDGLSNTNANARARAIVIHAAAYAEPDMIRQHGKLGRSNGCIVFSGADLETVLGTVPRGTLIFVGK